ncbi:MAG TPA: NADH-quinone oxidoreductase subunit J [Methanoregulaceae archaeon]|nr:NADH-quinone oxidoreductase subunit J [Methanoregulaceae archaeon]HPD75085.1 NADH-quinone oxidoreductase subunit J [Methanoregulaceae archaeon]HRY75447.1 NADH-quinone oxidoreductase subunit J [Methanoregulaceae archaeon]
MPEYTILVIAALCCATVAAALLAVVHTNLIRSIAAFAVSSICLAGTFFLLSSPYAGALELTVGAGLVAVLFLVALILSGGEETEVPS